MPDRSIRDLVATYLRPHRSRLVLLAACFLAGIGLQLLNPLLAKTFIDRSAAGESFDELVRIAALFLVVALLTQVSTVTEVWVAEDLGWRTTNALRSDLSAHVLSLDDRFHADHGAGELLERIDGDVGAIAGFFARFVVHVLGSGLFLLGVLALLWWEDWRIGLALTTIAAGTLVHLLRGGSSVARHSQASRGVSADLSSYLEERLSALPDIKANGADDVTMLGLHERLAARFHADRRSFLASSLFFSGASTALVVATVASLAIAAWLHGRGEVTLGGVYLVFRYTGMLRIPLEHLARHMNSFQRAMGGIVRVHELLSTRSRVTDHDTTTPLPDGPLRVELRTLDFAYSDAELVLQDVSFAVEPGRVLGLVGRTGAGKTTIARLVCRLIDPHDGAVRLGGVDLRDASIEDLRERVALVTQDVHLFSGTLRDNVRLFDSSVEDDRIADVFDTLDLRSWLDELPDGLDTELGPTARGLSAGEAQLVALARAFLGRPGVVVLDEASSRLDPHTEELLDHAVDRLLDGRTGIVIAHRLRTIQRVDDVLVLERGRIVEHGERAALAADPSSRFAELLRTGLVDEVPA